MSLARKFAISLAVASMAASSLAAAQAPVAVAKRASAPMIGANKATSSSTVVAVLGTLLAGGSIWLLTKGSEDKAPVSP